MGDHKGKEGSHFSSFGPVDSLKQNTIRLFIKEKEDFWKKTFSLTKSKHTSLDINNNSWSVASSISAVTTYNLKSNYMMMLGKGWGWVVEMTNKLQGINTELPVIIIMFSLTKYICCK